VSHPPHPPIEFAPHLTIRSGPFQQAVCERLPAGSLTPGPVRTRGEVVWGHTLRLDNGRLRIEYAGGGDAPPGELPVERFTCLDTGADGSIWLGAERGVVRLDGGRVEYYAGARWLPDDRVRRVRARPDGPVEIETAGGECRIRFRRLTLEEKAAHYEDLTDRRHRRFGYVTTSGLAAPGDLGRWRHHISDNDGLWTAMYAAAEAFRFAVTADPEARSKALDALEAILRLEAKSGLPGFPARALTHRDEPEFGNHTEGEWHTTSDGQWEWKGDTSSDEIDGHYFAWGILYDLLPDSDARGRIAAVVRRVTDRIIRDGLYLRDVDGRPTRWGVWAPEKLNHDPEWRSERGLNSLEMLAYLNVAFHITGDPRYRAATEELVRDHHYALNTLRQKVLPGDFPGAEDNHSDDELAFLAYYSLLRYEPDPDLRRIYLASIDRSWQIERPEQCPLWNFIYGAVTGRPCDAEAGVRALQQIPLDLVNHRMTNHHRSDIRLRSDPDRGGRPQAAAPLPWPERPLHKWNGNPYAVDGGNGLEEECGTFWLLPYWLGRFHRLVAATA